MPHMTYDRSKPFGLLTAELVDAVLAAQAKAARIKAVMDQVTGGGRAPANQEVGHQEGAATFGVPALQGQAFYDGVVSIKAALDSATAATLGDLDLGG